jgi:taurine dioxygenase
MTVSGRRAERQKGAFYIISDVDPGYTVRIDGMAEAESEELLKFLFQHQLQSRFQYAHRWSEGDVLVWDNL